MGTVIKLKLSVMLFDNMLIVTNDRSRYRQGRCHRQGQGDRRGAQAVVSPVCKRSSTPSEKPLDTIVSVRGEKLVGPSLDQAPHLGAIVLVGIARVECAHHGRD
jgi:hypothetical protein